MDRRTFGLGASAALLSTAAARAEGGPGALDGPRRQPQRQQAKFLILMLHGFGSDGADMIGLAPDFQAYAPTAAFAAPNGPFKMQGGYSWFPVGAPTGAKAPKGAPAEAGAPQGLEAFIDDELERHNLRPERLILIGFSQGASAVLNAGLRSKAPPAAIVAFSGFNLSPKGLKREERRPPVLLIQGDKDPRVPAGAEDKAVQVLKRAGAPATAYMLAGLGHGIDERGIRLAGELLRSVTGGAG